MSEPGAEAGAREAGGEEAGGAEAGGKVRRSEEAWRKRLSPEQFRITRRKGTERAFSGAYHDTKEPGTYRCVCCGRQLFLSDHKFDSGTGWPSFWRPAAAGAVETAPDRSLFLMPRTEVVCSCCDAHLGHVFDDGPEPTGERYCINSAALDFVPEEGGEDA